MITFSQLGQYGRLGNQLFQYSILVAISNINGYKIKIPDYRGRHHHGQDCLLDNFNITAEFVDNTDIPKYLYIEDAEFGCKYVPEVFNILDNTDLFGFFQNSKYYVNCEDILIRELTPNEKNINNAAKILSEIKNIYPEHEIVSLHLRRGDTNSGAYTIKNSTNLNRNSLWYKYFLESKKVFNDRKVKFLVFSGGNRDTSDDSDNYSWCLNNLVGDDFIYWDYDKTVMNDFTLMYLCDHHILAMGSTLSWWVGFLNKKKENKIIVAPNNYHGINAVGVDDGFYPNNFIVV